ncbi:MAG: dihydroorotase [Dehalococcoidia bacterium]|nr:dihydroorotase [Dehalococcoidia bacterium]
MAASVNKLAPGRILIKGGRIVDPWAGLDMTGDLLILKGKIEQVDREIRAAPGKDLLRIDASGLIVCPGFIDLHTHLREPGFEDKETIATGAMAGAAGGFTTLCCMPNTEPSIDRAATVEYILRKSSDAGSTRIRPIGCITKGRKGTELAEMGELAGAGVVGFSDDGSPVHNSSLMRHALEYSRAFDLPVIDHCEDLSLSKGGVMNEGKVAASLGLRGMPGAAEESMVERDIALARLTGGRLHLAHLSTARSVELVRQAKEEGLLVTAEVTPHHLTMTEEWVTGRKDGMVEDSVFLGLNAYDTNAKVNPPLRTGEDIAALIKGLNTGVIDAIATDHAPHTRTGKECEFDKAEFGISGLETALASLLLLVRRGDISLAGLISKLTSGPVAVLGKSCSGQNGFKPGNEADVTVFNPEMEWIVDPDRLFSLGKNTPLKGCKLKGKVMMTLVGGKITYIDKNIRTEVKV